MIHMKQEMDVGSGHVIHLVRRVRHVFGGTGALEGQL